jgi:hypothetical protein
MHYLSVVTFGVIVTFMLRSERSQGTKLGVGVIAIVALILQFFSPYPVVGALCSGGLGIILGIWLATDA